MTCSTKSLKILALIADAIYEIIGLCIVGFGVYLAFQIDIFDIAPFCIIALGIAIALIGAFGFLGAIRESSRLSKTYVVVLIIVIILQLLVIIFAWVFQNTALIIADTTFDQLWRNQTLPVRPENASPIADIEKMLNCCGSSGYTDYLHPPYSCYYHNTILNKEGCRQKFLNVFSEAITFGNIFGLILIAVELICAGLAYVLANSIVNRWRRSKYYAK